MSDPEYDIIIIGGGTAGCVLAARLSTVSDLQILLLEAGANRNGDPKVQTPLSSRQMFSDPDYDWDFKTEPQVDADDRVFLHTRGRMIGGSSAINSHSLVFPNREMHDTWARMASDDRWCWDQIKDCYARGYEEVGTSASLGAARGMVEAETSKPIKASYPHQLNELQRAWEDAFEALGMKSKNEGLSGDCFGGFTTTNAIDSRPEKGERSHAGSTYLQSAMSRSNLVVETEALVEQVVFRKTSINNSTGTPLTASGVKYEKNARTIFARASREVVLCAGAFGTPQILELSGIGRRNVLENAGVECLLDLPGVGENLQDHLNFGPSVEIRSDIETIDAAIRDPTLMAAYREQYLKYRTGPLAEGAAYSFAFWPLQLFNTPTEEEELKRLLDSHSPGHQRHAQREDFIKRMILSPKEASATVFMTRMQRYTAPGNKADGNYMSIIAMLSHPFSTGSVHIKTADPNDHPKIDCAYLSHPLDAEVLSRHCIQIERLLEQPIYAGIVKPGGQRLPRGNEKPFRTVDDVRSAIRSHGATNYHPCGTCAMTTLDDEGVVDGSLRLYGTSNLRVCDASVFPIIPRGNILTTVYAVAEKAAEMLLKEYQQTCP